jgi:sulfotransferase family protein
LFHFDTGLGVMTSGDCRVIYLGGMGRSGSTLAERLLGELPGACVGGELVHLWQRGLIENERCGCGAPFADCPFWSQVGLAAFGGWRTVDVNRIAGLRALVDRTRHIPALARQSLADQTRRDLAEYNSYYQRLYRAIAVTSGCPVVVDSSKHASLAFCLSRADLDLRVIHVVRDSRAVAYSWSTKVARPESAAQSFMTRYSPTRAAAEWNMQNGALALLARSRTPVLRVRYEDLVSAVAATLERIAEFAGLPIETGGFSFVGGSGQSQWAQLTAAHTASGNPMRFSTGKITIRADDRWRTAMPEAQRRTVTALTLPMLSHYGYVKGTA